MIFSFINIHFLTLNIYLLLNCVIPLLVEGATLLFHQFMMWADIEFVAGEGRSDTRHIRMGPGEYIAVIA